MASHADQGLGAEALLSFTYPATLGELRGVSVAAATHAIRRCSVYQDRRRAAVCGYVRSADRCAELELISGFLIAYPVQPWILKLVGFFGAISKSSLN